MWDQPDPELSHGAILRYNIGIREFGWVSNNSKINRSNKCNTLNKGINT